MASTVPPEPTEHEISEVINFTSLNPVSDRSMVVRALQDNNRDVATVVMQFFDNPESFGQRYLTVWDDNMFSADRDGSNSENAFHIESVTQNDIIQGVPPSFPPAAVAPSRPPSRSNEHSSFGKTDWPTESVGRAAREDADMERALRESAQEAGIVLSQQESGVLNSSTATPHFGPANRSDYDQEQWAMVPITEMQLPTVCQPQLRKRDAKAPAFLIQGNSSRDNHGVGAILTIMHQIPLARNTLLSLGTPSDSYGFNNEWWKGQEILPPSVLAQVQSGQLPWDQRHGESPVVAEELHRLMAFLDQTDRSYGSANVLVDMISTQSEEPDKRLFDYLDGQDTSLARPWTQHVFLGDSSRANEDVQESFSLLEIAHQREKYSNIKTLYEALDYVLWHDIISQENLYETPKMAMFATMGDVLTFKIGRNGPEDSIELPTEFYPERYLATRRAEAARIQTAMIETINAMAQLQEKKDKLQNWRAAEGSRTRGRRHVLKRAMDEWEVYRDYLHGLGCFRAMEVSDFNTNLYPDYREAPCDMTDNEERQHYIARLLFRLAEKALQDFDRKTKALDLELKQLQTRLRFLGRVLTVPDKPRRPSLMLCNKYLLRGIATSADVVYVCSRIASATSGSSDQWWRLSYKPEDAQPVKTEQFEVGRVLHEVWQETKTPIIVYATEKALNEPLQPLSPALERFVRADNKAFCREIQQQQRESKDAAPVRDTEAVSPSKRKHRADSFDSMASNRASVGSNDGDVYRNSGDECQTITPTDMETSMDSNCPTIDISPTDSVMGGTETDVNGSKAPEMQELCKPPAFVAAAQTRTQQQGEAEDMEMTDTQDE